MLKCFTYIPVFHYKVKTLTFAEFFFSYNTNNYVSPIKPVDEFL